MPLVQTRGAASAQGFGEFAQVTAVNYIEDVFSCFLYTGTGATQTITNNIDLSTKGGLVWFKPRDTGNNHNLIDSARGLNKFLISNDTAAQGTTGAGYGVASFNTTGFSLDPPWTSSTNTTSTSYVSWTFRKQPKFFDVVTYTGTGSNTTIAHSLGSVPGSIIVKRTDTTAAWAVYHRSLANTEYLVLNSTAAKATGATWWNSTTPTSAVFSVGTDASVNDSGGTYVAYLFAHDAGGFGLTGTDNVISCGSFTTDGSGNATVNLGYEPQWIVRKITATAGNWVLSDTMRGLLASGDPTILNPNSSAVETTDTFININSTGFLAVGLAASRAFIYIAIRRGPMKVPTLGTSVFAPLARTGSGTNPTVVTTGTNPDLLMSFPRTANPSAYGTVFFDKLRGVSQFLQSANTNAEATTSGTFCLQSFLNTGFQTGADFVQGYLNYSGATYAQYAMTRAPSFFDEVCYTGTGADPQTVSHNLGVAPELMIFKARDVAAGWRFWGGNMAITEYLALSETSAVVTGSTFFGSTLPTSTSFYVGSGLSVAARTIVAYLFATCAGVSKVGTYTGTAAAQTINCGFTAGSRFVLIKRTDSTGDWYVWDSARGIIAGDDPYLLLNSTAAEVTNTDYIDTANAGFEISSTAPAAINASAGTFIFLAIA